MGSFDFTDDALVWTDSENGAAGRVHVRDLASGEETSFDPELGERCNLLGFDAEGDRIAMTQYCGTYDSGVRDDRVQVVTTDGEQVVTVQDSGVDGGQLVAGGDFLTLTAYERATGGTYVYDFEEGRLLRLSDGHSRGTSPAARRRATSSCGASRPAARSAPFGRSGAVGPPGRDHPLTRPSTDARRRTGIRTVSSASPIRIRPRRPVPRISGSTAGLIRSRRRHRRCRRPRTTTRLRAVLEQQLGPDAAPSPRRVDERISTSPGPLGRRSPAGRPDDGATHQWLAPSPSRTSYTGSWSPVGNGSGTAARLAAVRTSAHELGQGGAAGVLAPR